MYKNSAYLKKQKQDRQKLVISEIVRGLAFVLTIALAYLLIIAGV